jgi:hypothetical protein
MYLATYKYAYNIKLKNKQNKNMASKNYIYLLL